MDKAVDIDTEKRRGWQRFVRHGRILSKGALFIAYALFSLW